MTTQEIKKTDTPNRFLLCWQDNGRELLGSHIVVDFNPVIAASGLKGNFVIVHYQAKPPFLRRFGVAVSGEYYSVSYIEAETPYFTIWVNETNLIYPPNGVIVHPDSKLTIVHGVAKIHV